MRPEDSPDPVRGSVSPSQDDAHATRYSAWLADPDATGPEFPNGVPAADASNRPAQPAPRTERGWVTLPCQFGEYELLEEIGHGGMGVVYRARQQIGSGERFVALKVIRAGRLASAEAAERFLREAQAAAGLDHPGIVPIYDVGEVDGQHYFTMPLLPGGSLTDRLRDGPLPPQVGAKLVRHVAEAVQHAHERGVIHRDLKPSNILLGGEGAEVVASGWMPKVADFGLARMRESSVSVTGEVMDTPSYMAPEQARGDVRATGPATDVYGLGRCCTACSWAGRRSRRPRRSRRCGRSATPSRCARAT